MFKVLSTCALFFSLVFGEIFINNPVGSTQWTAGQAQTVSWISSDGSPLTGTVSIVLRNGDPNALNPGTTLASAIPAGSGSTSVQLPDNLAPGSDYTISIVDNNNASVYSHTFAIAGSGNPLQASSS
ncbi:hypothetical protein BB560_005304, partial [Smittium megazygosporum]